MFLMILSQWYNKVSNIYYEWIGITDEYIYSLPIFTDTKYLETSQALVNAADRDAISGWGAVVYIIEKDKITEKHVKTRMD